MGADLLCWVCVWFRAHEPNNRSVWEEGRDEIESFFCVTLFRLVWGGNIHEQKAHSHKIPRIAYAGSESTTVEYSDNFGCVAIWNVRSEYVSG